MIVKKRYMKQISKRFILFFVLIFTLALLVACTDTASNNVVDAKINDDNELVFEMSDGTFINVGEVKGEDGLPGVEGLGIKQITVNPNGRLLIVLSDNKVLDLGVVVGNDGYQGADGQDGHDGLSAYEKYLLEYPGYPGTEEEWVNELVLGTLSLEINFDLKGGELENKPERIMKGDYFNLEPSKEDYIFENWLLEDGSVFNPENPIIKNTKLTATYFRQASFRDTYDLHTTGGIFKEFELKLGVFSLDLSAMKSITVDGKPIEIDTETLFFDVGNKAGLYNYVFIDEENVKYKATLEWDGESVLDLDEGFTKLDAKVGDLKPLVTDDYLVYQPYNVTTENVTISDNAVAYVINPNEIISKSIVEKNDGDVVFGLPANTFDNPQIAGKYQVVILDEGEKYVVEVESDQLAVAKVYENELEEFVVLLKGYETEIDRVEKEFIHDWNKYFDTTFTKVEDLQFYNFATEETGSIWGGGPGDISTYNIYKFFNDFSMNKKWEWILDFLIDESYETWTKAQAQAIKGDGTFPGESALYYADHLLGSLGNMFALKGGSSLRGAGAGNFSDYLGKDILAEYNTTVLGYNYHDLYYVGDKVTLPNYEKEYYTFKHYLLGNDEIAGGKEITITDENAIYVPQVEVNVFEVKFYEGDSEFTDLAKGFDYKDDFVFETLEKEGFVFVGWFDNKELTGDPVRRLPLNSTSDLTYYAKFEESQYNKVDITLDLDGGYVDADLLFELHGEIDHVVATSTNINTGFNIALRKFAPGDYWTTLGMKELAPGVYQVVVNGLWSEVKGEAPDNLDLFLAYHDAITSPFASKIEELFGLTNEGDVLFIPEMPEFDENPNQVVDFETTIYFTLEGAKEQIVFGQYDPMVLPELSKPGYLFVEWYDNKDLTGEPIEEFPGYTKDTDVTKVTYYPKWELVKYNDTDITLVFNYGYPTFEMLGLDKETPDLEISHDDDVSGKETIIRPTVRDWWHNVGFNKIADGIYLLVDKGTSSEINGNLDLYIAYHDDNENKSSLEKMFNELPLGTLLYLDGDLDNLSKETPVDIHFVSQENTVSYTYKAHDPVALPTPISDDPAYEFAGWFTNPKFRGEAVEKFPGFEADKTNENAITYYAKWVRKK